MYLTFLQNRISHEARRILQAAPGRRTEEDIYYVSKHHDTYTFFVIVTGGTGNMSWYGLEVTPNIIMLHQ